MKVEFHPEPRVVVQKALLAEPHQARLSHGPSVTADELVPLRVVSLQVALREQPVLRREARPSAMRREQP